MCEQVSAAGVEAESIKGKAGPNHDEPPVHVWKPYTLQPAQQWCTLSIISNATNSKYDQLQPTASVLVI